MSKNDNNILGDISPEDFLKRYWQKKPCLIQQAIPGFVCPLSPEELAGLACEKDSEARLVIEERDKTHDWRVQYGPFSEAVFRQLPQSHWSLLVRHVDHYLPEINALLSRFNFIPGWRLDDVMVSYAADRGSVGPHLDSYDVFLLQGLGQRHWQINCHDYTEQDFIPGQELRVLREFRPEQEWTLSPGDMLYLPPGIAHHGVARGLCMTLSIGFLAPRSSDLVHNYIDDVISASADDHRFTDPDRFPQSHAGEITAIDLARIKSMMRATLADENAINHWFGRYITDSPVEPEQPRPVPSAGAFRDRIAGTGCLQRYGGIRAAYTRDADSVCLFIHGMAFPFRTDQLELVQLITGKTTFYPDDILNHRKEKELIEILLELYNHGFYYFDG